MTFLRDTLPGLPSHQGRPCLAALLEYYLQPYDSTLAFPTTNQNVRLFSHLLCLSIPPCSACPSLPAVPVLPSAMPVLHSLLSSCPALLCPCPSTSSDELSYEAPYHLPAWYVVTSSRPIRAVLRPCTLGVEWRKGFVPDGERPA